MKRRDLRFDPLVLGLISLIGALGTGTVVVAQGDESNTSAATPPSQPTVPAESEEASETVLVFLPDAAAAKDVLSGIKDEVAGDFEIQSRNVSRKTTITEMSKAIAAVKPVAIVLMDNPTIELYRRVQKAAPARTFPPVVMVMASFLEAASAGIRNATGIKYEVPALTSVSQLRKLLEQPVRTVGVIGRPALRQVVHDQMELAQRSGVQLEPVWVESKRLRYDTKRALRFLLEQRQVDALWILNDNALLTPDMIEQTWLPALEFFKRPVIVGVSSLVSDKFQFGSFGVLPDHLALGAQTAEILFELKDQDWQPDELPEISEPVSVKTYLLKLYAEKNFQLQGDAFKRVDRLVGGNEADAATAGR